MRPNRVTPAALLALIAVQRVGALLLLRPGGVLYDYSDYDTYWLYARYLAEGFWPFRDFWLEYPPLFPLANQTLFALSQHFPPLPDGRFWHHLLLGLALLPFDLGAAWLLHRIATQLRGAAAGQWTLSVWALLFAPLFLWQGNFDVALLFTLLLALWALLERRPLLVGGAVALGILVKLLGVLVLPAALMAFADRPGSPRTFASGANGRMLAMLAVGMALGLLPFLILAPEWLAAFARSVTGRGAWQSLWALAEGNYDFGIVYGDRFDPAVTFPAAPGRLPWPAIHALFGATGLALWLGPWEWRRPRVPVAFVAATLFLFLLWSKGWSPQFTLLILPFVLLLRPDAAGLVIALLLTALMGWEMIYFARLALAGEARWMLQAIILCRTTLLLLLSLIAVGMLRDGRPRPASQP